MVDIIYSCPKCENIVRRELEMSALGEQCTLDCPKCTYTLPARPDGIRDGQVHHCVVCGGGELYVRKDFSQRLGVGIVVIGMLLSTLTWYYYMIFLTFAILFAAAAVDAILYFVVGNMLQCYRCQAQYRGLPGLEHREAFNLETHERYRQQAARTREQQISI